MGTKSKREIQLGFIWSLRILRRFYLRYKRKLSIVFNYNLRLSIEFIYKYLHLYSIVFMSALKKLRILEFFFLISEFRIKDIQSVLTLRAQPIAPQARRNSGVKLQTRVVR
jgi:hypothetical protein